MEARNRNLSDWLTRIRTRQIALPRFQRYEAWSYSQVENLLNTVLLGLPAGAVLKYSFKSYSVFHAHIFQHIKNTRFQHAEA